jgi:hypothetical protein
LNIGTNGTEIKVYISGLKLNLKKDFKRFCVPIREIDFSDAFSGGKHIVNSAFQKWS